MLFPPQGFGWISLRLKRESRRISDGPPIQTFGGDDLGKVIRGLFDTPLLAAGDSFTAAGKIDNLTSLGYFMGEV